MVVRENEKVEEILEVVKPILKSFQDMVLDQIPLGLTHMKDIQYHIDLISGYMLTNKSAYRMSLKVHEEACG